MMSFYDGCGGGTIWNFSFNSLMKCFRTFGYSLSRMWRCDLKPLLVNNLWNFGTLMLNPGLILSWGVQHGLCLSSNGKWPGYTYFPCLMWLGTFLFGPYTFSRKDPLSWRRQDWCFLTAWLVETGLALDLVLNALPFLVLIWGPFAVAGGAQVWLIVFSWGFFEIGPMIGLSKKWISFWWLLFPIQNEWGSSRMHSGSPPMWFLICTCKCSLQNIRQELWTPSLVSFAGSSLTYKVLYTRLVFPSW